MGIITSLSNEEYHARKDAISNSGITDILQSPLHYYARHLDPQRPPRQVKAGQLEGTLAHCAILEPDEFDSRYRIGPAVSRATKAWKEAAEQALADGVELIKPEQYDVAWAQADSVRRIEDARYLLSKGKPEVSAFWTDADTGAQCRCRPDWVHGEDGAILVDVKTCGDASPDDFARQIARKGYHRQDAFYVDGYSEAAGVGVAGFIFLAVEATWPYAASLVSLDDDSRDQGRHEYKRALELYRECMTFNDWPGYSRGIQQIRLPNWRLA